MQDGDSFINGLYLVATPIGNLGDISLRALDVLKKADLVACEDTRNTGRLFSLLGISASLTAYHEYNVDKARPMLMSRLKNGETIALVSDAGTPLVSDPGYKLVQDCIKEGIYVTAVPGASAVLTAVQLSGLPSDRFLFQGFLSPKTVARKAQLQELAFVPATLVFYESAQRILETLNDIRIVLGNRKVALCRELTKKFEEIVRAPVEELISLYTEKGLPKGECVLVVGPAEKEKTSIGDIEKLLSESLQTMSVKDAVAYVAEMTSCPKKEIYALALKLKNNAK